MATDINTQLQNISTDVTAIGNVVNRLLTIFSGGGVQNPDIATAKAELQGWVTSNYVPLANVEVTLGGLYTFNRGLITHYFEKRTNNETPYTIGDNITNSIYWNFRVVDNAGVAVGAILHALTPGQNNLHGNFVFESWALRHLPSVYNLGSPLSSVEVAFRTILKSDNNIYYTYFGIPTIPIEYQDYLGDAAVSKSYLDNLANSVVHKSGTEIVDGLKRFTNNVELERGIYIHRKDIDSTQLYQDNQYGFLFNAEDKNGVRLHRISGTVDTNGDSQVWVYAQSFGSGSRSDTCRFNVCSASSTNQYKDFESYIITKALIVSKGLVPNTSGDISLGLASKLWSQVYASNATIQTSDENLKTEISAVPENVLRAWGKVNFQQFKFKDAVAKKGANARIHIGVIAQRIQEAFQSEGLDAKKYGLFCWDEWGDLYENEQVLVKPEVRGQVKVIDSQAIYNIISKDDGTEEQVLVSPERSHMEEQVIEEAVYRTEKKLVQPAGSRYSVRYEECLALECAYQRWQLNLIKQKLGM